MLDVEFPVFVEERGGVGVSRELLLGAVYYLHVWVRRVLAFCWLGVLELEQCFCNVARYRQVDLSSFVISVKGDADVFVSFPVVFDVVVPPYCVD